MASRDAPAVSSSEVVYGTDWFRLEEKRGRGFDTPYYVLTAADCVTVLPLGADGRIAFVRQWRPALEAFSLELPGGHVEREETPEAAARRELGEETGLAALELAKLGTLAPDAGRSGHVLHVFWARVSLEQSPTAREVGVEVVLRASTELRGMLQRGELRHALDLSVCLLALAHGRLSL